MFTAGEVEYGRDVVYGFYSLSDTEAHECHRLELVVGDESAVG